MSTTAPSQSPPPVATAQPPVPELSASELKLLPKIGTHATPSQAVEGVVSQAGAAAASTWHDGKTVVSQWTINQDRNTWMGVSGIGWQKLSTASDSGCVALTMLAASALISKRPVNYLQESDGMVHQIYLF
jgi:hypothetical protein